MKVEYQNAQVFDGHKFVKQNFTVENGTFTAVGTNNQSADQTVDLTGYYVTPGLINAHTHITLAADPHYWDNKEQNAVTKTVLAIQNLKESLTVGVTFVRDVGSTEDVDLNLMKLHLSDLPGIVASGSALSMTGGHGAKGGLEVDGVDEARKGARTVLKKGAKNVKVMATGGVATPGETPYDVQLSEDEIRAAVVEAHHKGFPTAAHAQGTEGIKNAVRAGIDSVEHAIFMDDEAVKLMKQYGTVVVPTLVAPRAIYENPEELPYFMVKKARLVAKPHFASIQKLVQNGVPIAMGTDSGCPYDDFSHWVVNEMKMYQDAGMTPEQVLNSSTMVAAKLLRVEDRVGAVKENLAADFVVLKNNPLDNLSAFEQEIAVYHNGRQIVNRLEKAGD